MGSLKPFLKEEWEMEIAFYTERKCFWTTEKAHGMVRK